MDKTKTETPSAAIRFDTTPRVDHERRVDQPPPTFVNNELRFARWKREQEQLDDKDDDAWDEHPPGGKLYVTAVSSIPVRTRAGIGFPNTARVEVEIIDATDDEVRGLQLQGHAVVNPVGAKAIIEDTGPAGGLIVFDAAGMGSVAPQVNLDEISDEEFARRQADMKAAAGRRAERRESRKGQGAPERIGRNKPPVEEPPKG